MMKNVLCGIELSSEQCNHYVYFDRMRSYFKNLYFVFEWGFQTPRNNKNTQHSQFLGVWNPHSNTKYELLKYYFQCPLTDFQLVHVVSMKVPHTLLRSVLIARAFRVGECLEAPVRGPVHIVPAQVIGPSPTLAIKLQCKHLVAQLSSLSRAPAGETVNVKSKLQIRNGLFKDLGSVLVTD